MKFNSLSALVTAVAFAVPTAAAASGTCISSTCAIGAEIDLSWGTESWNVGPGETFASISPAGPVGESGFATRIWYDPTAARGTADDRDDATNALGNNENSFFELGFHGKARVGFDFTNMGLEASVVEVTYGNAENWKEAVDVFAGSNADGSDVRYLGRIENFVGPFTLPEDTTPGGPFASAIAPATVGSYRFDYLFFEDVTPDLYPNTASTVTSDGNPKPNGGFDLAEVKVEKTNEAVEVPEISAAHGLAALAFLSSLLMLTWERRRPTA